MSNEDELDLDQSETPEPPLQDALDERGQLTELQMSFIATHEAFVAAINAGFSPQASLFLVACMLCGGPQPPRNMEGS